MIILIPAYEPSERLTQLVHRLAAARPTVKVIVVDDGSGRAHEPVFAEAAALGAEVLRHDRNRGKGAALKTGLLHAMQCHPGEGVVTADADGQHTAADILAVAEDVRALGEACGEQIVLGCRAFTGEVPLRSRAGNMIARRLFRAAAGWDLTDTQTGLRGIPASMLDWARSVPGERFEYEQRMLLQLQLAGYGARERRIDTVYLDDNASSHFRPVLDSLRVTLPVLVFAMSSLLAFAVDTVALLVFNAITGALVPSIIAARLVSATVNFAVNRRIVFLHRGRARLRRQAASYALLAAALLVSNIVWMSFLTDAGLPVWVAKIVTEAVLFFMSYRVQRGAVFAPSQAVTAAGPGAGFGTNEKTPALASGGPSRAPRDSNPRPSDP